MNISSIQAARRVLGMSPGEEAFAGVRYPRMVVHEFVKAVRGEPAS